ncbi:hypothetical protein FACS1894139_00700 [Planctomycetales bacterium]|nr:hypothetical protein FACS1894107_06340 [Planctomycetales bacterium]GHT02483.1 hypothetical protein FACS1894139_00700 [Planctomycetales bacterium]
MTFREVEKMIKNDGWFLVKIRGSHYHEELPPPPLADVTPDASGVAAWVNVDLPTVRANRAACLA